MVSKKLKAFNLELFIKYLLLSLLSKIQIDGKKEVVENLLKRSLSILKKTTKSNPSFILFCILKQIKPFCEIRKLKIGGKIHRIPVAIRSLKQKIMSIKWLTLAIIERNELFFEVRFSKEVVETYEWSSKSINFCESIHKIAESNKIYMQFKN